MCAREPIGATAVGDPVIHPPAEDAPPNLQEQPDEGPTDTERVTSASDTEEPAAPVNLPEPMDADADGATSVTGPVVDAGTPEYVSLPRQPLPVVRRDDELVDPLDASVTFPSRKGAAQPPPLNLHALVAAYPADDRDWAMPMVLSQLNVGVSFVTVFGILLPLIRTDLRSLGEESRDKLLRTIQANPYAFQSDVARGCQNLQDNGTWLYRPDVQPNRFVGTVTLFPGDVMDLWRWPATSASRQTNFALQRAIYKVLGHGNSNRYQQILAMPCAP